MTAQAGSAQVGVKLSADQLAASFPFYVAFDDDLRVVQFGSGLAQLVPALAVGVPVHSALTLIQPTADWSMDRLRDSGDVPILVQVVGSDVHLVGPIVRIPDRPALFAYLAVRLRGAVPPQSTEPWNRQVSVVTAEGDSARPTTDSLKAENAELTQLNRALAQREWRLQAEIAQFRVRNAELEQTARELSNAQRVAEFGTWRYCIVEDRMEWSEELGRILDIKHGEFGTSLQSWLTLVHPADRARVESAVNARGPRDLDLDFRVIRRDGQRRYVHLRSRLDPDSNPPDYGSGTIQDVTDLRRTEKKVSAQRSQIRKLALVAARTDNGVVITNAEGRIEWANHAFRRQTGYGPERLRGQKPGDLLQVDASDTRVIEHMRSQLRRGLGFHVELINAAADGRRYWVALEVQPVRDAQNNVTHYISVQRDITSARLQQAALERLRAERDMILNLSPDGFLAFDEVGHPVYSNPAAARFMGLDAAQLHGLTETDVERVFIELVGGVDSYLPASALSDGGFDVLRFIKSGCALRRTIREVKGPIGEPRGRVVYLRDITSEMELDRMRSEFLATAAHELRTPMSSIHGFSELLLNRELDPPIQREVVQTIHTQSNFVVRMVNDLLDLERISSGSDKNELHITEFALAPVLRRAVDGVLVEGDDRRVDLNLDDAVTLSVVADADKLLQALLNVISNAFRYSRAQGGAIELSIRRRGDALRSEVGIAVRDYGIGMTPSQLERVFDRFYRADPHAAVPGTGLGMTLVKEIMSRMGGDVEIDSTFGAGTTVTLWLLRGAG